MIALRLILVVMVASTFGAIVGWTLAYGTDWLRNNRAARVLVFFVILVLLLVMSGMVKGN